MQLMDFGDKEWTTMAKIRIHNMMFYGFHGVYEYEREQGQKFYVDVEVETKTDDMADTDDIKDGVDPAAVYDIVKDVVENTRFQLLGALSAHVGIYSGDRQFINASSSHGVSVASLDSSYWGACYIGARRVL